jgi:hypothetical protein
MRKLPILLGGLAQTVAFTALLVVVQPPTPVYVATPAVAGVVAGVSSDRLKSLHLDTGGAGIVGTFLSLGAGGVIVWQNLAGVPTDARIDLTMLMVLFGIGALIVLLPVALLTSVVVGQFTAVLWDELLAS